MKTVEEYFKMNEIPFIASGSRIVIKTVIYEEQKQEMLKSFECLNCDYFITDLMNGNTCFSPKDDFLRIAERNISKLNDVS